MSRSVTDVRVIWLFTVFFIQKLAQLLNNSTALPRPQVFDVYLQIGTQVRLVTSIPVFLDDSYKRDFFANAIIIASH